MSERQGVQSIEVGLRLVRLLAERAQPLALKDLAAGAHMPAAKAHRYLVSLIRAGLAEQDRESGRYRLGPLALDIGLSALRQVDVLKFGGEALAELHAAIDETVLLAIWGNKGPVVARWEESTRPVATNVRAGWVMPMLNSATGRCFAAYLPDAVTAPLLEAELAPMPEERARYPARLDEIRAHGLSRVEGDLLRGVASVAAPVFGHGGGIVAVIAALGPQGAFDVAWDGGNARAVKDAAARLSARLGFRSFPSPWGEGEGGEGESLGL
jgi:DNA-binding IclR family transcriptional regulator